MTIYRQVGAIKKAEQLQRLDTIEDVLASMQSRGTKFYWPEPEPDHDYDVIYLPDQSGDRDLPARLTARGAPHSSRASRPGG